LRSVKIALIRIGAAVIEEKKEGRRLNAALRFIAYWSREIIFS
jgi:hypothetical protein